MSTKIDDGSKTNPNAYSIARDANENHFSSRRGIGAWKPGEEGAGFYVYDNNPLGPLPSERRAEMFRKLASAMEAHGCKVVERAYYPTAGEDAGYTFAVIFRSAETNNAGDDEDTAREELSRIIAEDLDAHASHAPEVGLVKALHGTPDEAGSRAPMN